MLHLSCFMWDLMLWPGIKPGPPALGAQSLSHSITVKSLSFFRKGSWPWFFASSTVLNTGSRAEQGLSEYWLSEWFCFRQRYLRVCGIAPTLRCLDEVVIQSLAGKMSCQRFETDRQDWECPHSLKHLHYQEQGCSETPWTAENKEVIFFFFFSVRGSSKFFKIEI